MKEQDLDHICRTYRNTVVRDIDQRILTVPNPRPRPAPEKETLRPGPREPFPWTGSDEFWGSDEHAVGCVLVITVVLFVVGFVAFWMKMF